MIIVLALFWAWFIEGLIEYLKPLWKWINGKSWWIALLLGLFVAWASNLQIVNYLTLEVSQVVDGSVFSIPVYLDYIVTGIAIGRGSSMVNSIVEYLYGLKKELN